MSSDKIMLLMGTENRDWARWLRIPALYSKEARNDATYYLYVLCTSIFIDVPIDPVVKGEPEALRSNRLKYVRTVFIIYGIKQPEHWSPILTVSDSDIDESQQREGINMFNEAIKNLRYYLTPDQEFRKELARDIEKRYENCQKLAEELKQVADEDNFYYDKINKIEVFLKDRTEPDKNVANEIIKKLYDSNYPDSSRNRASTTK